NMMRITISGDDFTFSTKETGSFVETNTGTLQIENAENGKEVTFTITGGMSETGEWVTASEEPQILVASLSDDGKSLTLDELAYTKKWKPWDDILAFINGKEKAGNESAEPAVVRAVVSADSANFREGPSTGANALKILSKGDVLTVTGDADNGWLPVEHDGVQGYVSADLLSAAPAPVPAIFGGRTLPGLYEGSAYLGYMDLPETMNWIAENAEDGGVYSVVPGKNQKVSNIRLDYGDRQVTVSLKAAGEEQDIITYTNERADSPLFTVGAGAALTLEDGVVLSGLRNGKNNALVVVDGGAFIMNGGEMRNNTRSSDLGDNTVSTGGGVRVVTGTFTMNGGTIGGNAAKLGGGVYIDETGAFTMNGGTIGDNASSGSDSYGGGVYVDGGTFTMNDGSISGNSSDGNGGGVSVRAGGTFAMYGGSIGGNAANHGAGVHGNMSTGGTFTKSGGVIYGSNAPEEQQNRAGQGGHAVYMYISEDDQKTRDSTAGENTALDSDRGGAAGGWGR
ncbi:MAG: SH3 domain-containing protein, partial [Treponema sp.]|nr:SH3 domain-containing protein [Treponema sp.]